MMANHAPRDADSAIRSTDTDAAQARLSAVRRTYLQDPFIHFFVQRAHLIPNRPPLINIGTYIRSEAIDALIARFFSLFEENEPVQIVSLGAGSDTRFWRLSSGPNCTRLTKYVEIDFPEVTARKLAIIRKHSDLQNVVGDLVSEHGGTGCKSQVYHLLPADLRCDPQHSLHPLTDILDPKLPTLVIAECVFAYMETSMSEQILRWFTDRFSTMGSLIYEMFALGDAFGQVMKENLRARQIILAGVDAYGNLQSLCSRLSSSGFSETNAISLKSLWLEFIADSELTRIAAIEKIDEWEEILLVLDHYAISWASKSPNQSRSIQWGFKI